MNKNRKCTLGRLPGGFSLVEMMVVLAIAAILLGMGVPAFGDMIQRQRITTAANEFIAAIHLTRSEAIKRGDRVDLVPAGKDWSMGWSIIVDQNGNQQSDAGDDVIFLHGPMPDGMSVVSKLSDNAIPYLAYNGTGRTRTNASALAPQFGSFQFRMAGEKRNVVINMLGRAYVCTPEGEEESC